MATLLTKKSDTSSSVPLAADLTNAAGGAELAVNTADKRLYTKTSGGSIVELGTNPSSLALPSGTANGVAYLNGSKVLTTGSALTFDGTNFGVGTAPVSGYKAAINGDIWQGNTGGVIIGSIINNGGWYELGGSANVNGLQFAHAATQRWVINSSEQMRLTSTGLGIGTSSPDQKLVVQGSNVSMKVADGTYSSFVATISSANAYGNGSTVGQLYLRGQAGIGFTGNSGGATQMVLDSSGNLGLGVTPSAWAAQYKAFQFGNLGGGSLAQDNTNGFTHFSQNTTFTGNNSAVYQTGGYATNYLQTGGQHIWRTAPSGTAGNAISFTQAMTLDASGNLLVGCTTSPFGSAPGVALVKESPGGFLQTGTNTTASRVSAIFYNPNGVVGTIATSGGATSYNTASDYRLKNTIAPMTGALAKVALLKPVTYKWKADGSHGEGFIAHELAEVCPDAVTGEKDAVDAEGKPQYQGIDVSFLVGTLTAAIQEQQALINELKARLDAANL